MARSCTVCHHERRDEIDEAVVADRASIRRIATQFEITESALRRHRDNHLSPAIQKVHAERQAERAEVVVSLYDELQGLIRTVRTAVERAERRNHTEQMLKAVGEMRRLLEVMGKLTGELKDGPTVAINLLTSPEWLQVRQTILDTLADHPELRYELASRLQAIEASTE